MLKNLVPNLFFLFFVAQILSPSIGGKTIYLEVFIAFLDSKFRVWLLSKLKKSSVYFVIVLIPLYFLKVSGSFKIACMMITVSYLFYAWKYNVFLLKRYFVVSVLFAVLQFVFMYIDPYVAVSLGPNNISHIIWGQYAIQTNTNFYAVISDMIRVSGLAREAGFFASLLVSLSLLTFVEYRLGTKIKTWWIIVLVIAFFLSISKMSFVILPILFVILFEKRINYIHPLFVVLLFFVTMLLLWYHSQYILQSSAVTFLHRFGAYAIFTDINNIQLLLFGSDKVCSNDFDGLYAMKFWNVSEYGFYAGLAGTIFMNGLVLTVIYLIFLSKYISATGMLLLLLLTINVDIMTNQNFVSLSYFIIFKYFRSYRNFCHAKSNQLIFRSRC